MIEEVNILIKRVKETQDVNLSKEHAEEIINIYFECYSDAWRYFDFLTEEIRVINKKECASILDSLKDMDDIALFEGNDYILITNYQTLLNMNGGLNIFPEHSF